ncbi:hypothetical protein HMPREF1861_00319 [Corynebacterium kroppenstedtii]|nr:hypothetical protein HMPREF1861_00319 [Corynebacterium kroppenstedtii]
MQHPRTNVDCYDDGFYCNDDFRLHSAKQTTPKLLHYSSIFFNSTDVIGVSTEA